MTALCAGMDHIKRSKERSTHKETDRDAGWDTGDFAGRCRDPGHSLKPPALWQTTRGTPSLSGQQRGQEHRTRTLNCETRSVVSCGFKRRQGKKKNRIVMSIFIPNFACIERLHSSPSFDVKPFYLHFLSHRLTGRLAQLDERKRPRVIQPSYATWRPAMRLPQQRAISENGSRAI